MVRTPFCDKSGLRKGTWTLEEDMKLVAYVTRYGSWNWSQLPKFAGLARCGKSCRLRWLNYLRPNLKRANFTPEEEYMIIRLHTTLGNRWSAIASNLPGRTGNEIKNHWHTTLKKRLQQKEFTKEEPKSSKSKDNDSSSEGDLVLNDGVLQVDPSECTSPLSSSSAFSPITSDSKTAASNENLVLENDFTFLDSYIEPMIENFWTEPCMAEISHPTNEIVTDHDNHEFQSADSIETPDASALMPPVPALENEFSFFDYHIKAMIENFWSEPYMSIFFHGE